MKEAFLMFAKYNKSGNKSIYAILDKLSNDDREKDRGSYYKSLSGLLRHILEGTIFLSGLYKTALGGSAAALKALAPLEGIAVPKNSLSEAQWKELGTMLDSADAALENLAAALNETDLDLPVKIDWYGGKPGSVPLSFMLHQLTVHNVHHRGQISQILDSLKIDNDYSGISPAFL
ncbi:MAG: DUF664 domain-containing protein [Treponema sp.]|jgi:uncharacterized damage-inducible protein DinB|nr:DUF664 domain-containing protein [Treponema sp.]